MVQYHVVTSDAPTDESVYLKVWHELDGAEVYTEFRNGPDGSVVDQHGKTIDMTYPMGITLREEWWRDGKLHRKNNPAITIFHPENRERIETYFFFDGKLHSPPSGCAAVEIRDPTTLMLVRQEYRRDGELHRERGPALRTYTSEGDVLSDEYYLNGRLVNKSRLDHPDYWSHNEP